MKKNIMCLSLVFLISLIFLQTTNCNCKSEIKNGPLKPKDTLVIKILNQPFLLSNDTIKIKTFQPEQGTKSTGKNMPWIAALIVGLLTILANVLLNKSLRDLSKESLKQQLDNGLKINQLQFKSSLASNNRQTWINSLRDNISEFISRVISLHLLIAKEGKDNLAHKSKEYDELHTLRWKIVLMLNSNNEIEHKELEEMIDNAFKFESNNEDFFVNLDKIKEQTQKIIKNEWEVIKTTNC
jgi:hypothetical protein